MTPKLNEAVAVSYLCRALGIKDIKKATFDEAIEYLLEAGVPLPPGLESATLMIDRINVPGSIWNLNKKSPIVQTCKEIFDDQDQCYFVVSDANLQSADALFLCAASLSADKQFSHNDMEAVVEDWVNYNKGAAPSIITASKYLNNEGFFTVTAVRISSLKDEVRSE